MNINEANFDNVKALHDTLLKAFEDFVNDFGIKNEDALKYVDGLMGCHNFYKAIILNLEQEANDKDKIIRIIAIDTMIKAFGLEDYYHRRRNNSCRN